MSGAATNLGAANRASARSASRSPRYLPRCSASRAGPANSKAATAIPCACRRGGGRREAVSAAVHASQSGAAETSSHAAQRRGASAFTARRASDRSIADDFGATLGAFPGQQVSLPATSAGLCRGSGAQNLRGPCAAGRSAGEYIAACDANGVARGVQGGSVIQSPALTLSLSPKPQCFQRVSRRRRASHRLPQERRRGVRRLPCCAAQSA